MTTQSINVNYGEVVINNYNNCLLNSNGVTYNYSIGGVVPGLWFGLIHYDCDNVKGTLVSKLECKPCALFCTYNELIPHCSSLVLPLVLSLLLSIIVTGIAMTLLHKPFMKVTKAMYYKILYKCISHDDKIMYRYTKRNNMATHINMPINFNDKAKMLNNSNYDKLMSSRANKVYKLKNKTRKGTK